jgi:O-antigen ligase
MRMIADQPLTGVGPQNFKEFSLAYAPDLSKAYIAHNTYLELAAETGLPVLVLFLLIVWQAFRTLNRAARLRGSPEARELAGWAEGMRSGLLGFMVAGGFISAQYEKMFWVTIFLSIVIGRLTREYAVRVREEAPSEPGFAALPLPQASS